MNKMNIKKGDLVQVISGKDRGPAGSPTQGKVMRAMPAERKVVVAGVGIVKKSVKPNGTNQQGGIVEREAPIHMSNVLPWCESAGRPSRVGVKHLEDGSRVRYYKVNGETLND